MGYVSRMIVFPNLQDNGETEHEIKTLTLRQPTRLIQAWSKARHLNGYGAPYRVRLYGLEPHNPEACWFAELSSADIEADPRTADYLNASLSLVIPAGRLFVTYQLLSANVQPSAHLALHLTFEE